MSEEYMFENPYELLDKGFDKYDFAQIIILLQADRREWIEQYTKSHNDYVNLQQENQQLKEILHNINASDGVTTTPVLDLIKENRQLKEDLHQASISIQEMVEMDIMCPTNCDKLNKYKSILDEIREVINQNMSSYSSCIKAFDEIEEILDKVESNDSKRNV